MNNLALAIKDQGKCKEAEKLHHQCLEARKTLLGEAHPSTLKSTNNLAIVLQKQGRFIKAMKLQRQRQCLVAK
eukprot:13842890-Ditylum_brightwellii.AAC.1